MSSFIIRNRKRLNLYTKLLNKNNFGFFLLDGDYSKNNKYLSLSNKLLLLLIPLNNFNMFKGVNYFYNYSNFNEFLENVKQLQKSKSNLLLLIKINNLYFTPLFLKKKIMSLFNINSNINFFLLSLLFKFSIKFFLSIILFPVKTILNKKIYSNSFFENTKIN